MNQRDIADRGPRRVGGGRGPVQGLKTIADFSGWPVYLFCKGGDIDGKVVEADLYDDLWRRSKGQVPLELDISCPRCGQVSRIPGDLKTIRIERLEKPRQFVGPTGELHVQTFRITIHEVMTCDHPAEAGKGICGLRFRVTDNVVHRVG
jgi:hypothetical protein